MSCVDGYVADGLVCLGLMVSVSDENGVWRLEELGGMYSGFVNLFLSSFFHFIDCDIPFIVFYFS